MTIADENKLIELLAESLRFYGCDDPADERLEYGMGHSGEGWYLSCGEYPDEGAEFIAPHEYGAMLVAQTIVAEERAALTEKPDVELAVRSPAVSIQARLMAIGGAKYLAEDLAGRGDTPVLIFTAEEEELRKTGPLFRKLVSLTAMEIGP